MHYFARFERFDGDLFRFDTRIYLDSVDLDKEGVCVGAIVGKNPGSASPGELSHLGPLQLNGDKMLPTVGARFLAAYKKAKMPVPQNAFVRVWNLFYVCNSDLGAALRVANRRNEMPVCASEQELLPILWYGWGGADPRLDVYKVRFAGRKDAHPFFYDRYTNKVVAKAPSPSDFAKHTQGLLSGPVVDFLSRMLGAS